MSEVIQIIDTQLAKTRDRLDRAAVQIKTLSEHAATRLRVARQ
jgi:hypothetical protein